MADEDDMKFAGYTSLIFALNHLIDAGEGAKIRTRKSELGQEEDEGVQERIEEGKDATNGFEVRRSRLVPLMVLNILPNVLLRSL